MDVVDNDSNAETEVVSGVYLAQLAAGENMSLQHVRFDPGARVPEHSHPHEQAGYVYEGTVTFLLEGGAVTLEAGESYCVSGGQAHAVENPTDRPARVIDVFSPPRGDPDWSG